MTDDLDNELHDLHSTGPADTSGGQSAFGEVETVAEARRYQAMNFAIDLVRAVPAFFVDGYRPEAQLVEAAHVIEDYLSGDEKVTIVATMEDGTQMDLKDVPTGTPVTIDFGPRVTADKTGATK